MIDPIAMLRKFVHRRRLKGWLKLISAGSENHFMPGFSLTAKSLTHGQYVIGSRCMLSHGTFFERPGFGQVTIGDRCHIGGGTILISTAGIHIGNDVTIAWNCTVYDHNSHPLDWSLRANDTLQECADLVNCGDSLAHKDWSNVISKPIRIEDKVWIGFGVVILKGVTVGTGAVIGAGSVVTKDVPPFTVVAGNPAQIVKRLNSVESVK